MHLASRQCQGKATLLDDEAITRYLQEINNDWQSSADGTRIQRSFKFKNYYETITFVNIVAMIAHQQDHHPDLKVSYNHCVVEFSTHSVGGLSEFDFICAAKVNTRLPL